MQSSRQITDSIENSGSTLVSSTPAATAIFDIPDGAPWTGHWRHLLAAWLFGAVVLAGLVTYIMHFGTIEIFVATLRRANPGWLAMAVSFQLATYVCAAAVWFRVIQRAQAAVSFLSLLKLSLVELFANQAVPTGGISGSHMVMRGLTHRGVASEIAITALLVAALSYYIAYFLVGLLAFVLLWHTGDLNAAWKALFVAFTVAVITLGTVLLILSRSDLIPAAILRWRPFAQFARIAGRVPFDILRNPQLNFRSCSSPVRYLPA
jgi:glycosyltransferase 2 family protein